MVNSKFEHISDHSVRQWYAAMLVSYQTLNDANTAIDTKLTTFAALAIALLVFGLDSSLKKSLFLGIVGSISLLACSVTAIIGSKVKDTHRPVNTSEEQPTYYSLTDEEFNWQLIVDLESSITFIEISNASKAKFYRYTLVLFVIGAICIVMANILTLSFKFIV